MAAHKFPYKWALKDAVFTKDKGKVFSCFACGGGSTMGYKLAGFDVIGANEIDKSMADCYVYNHKPKFMFVEDIVEFSKRKDLPKELFSLDILDGSPPCSTFSMSGLREKSWGKEKKFREGQKNQKLDNLFFDFINLAKILQPKVIQAENVKGIILGNAITYVSKIYRELDKAGYIPFHYLLDASSMGVPQRRERVFFIAIRKDLWKKDFKPLDLNFNERGITFEQAEVEDSVDNHKIPLSLYPYYLKCAWGKSIASVHPKGSFFNNHKIHPQKVAPTIHPRIDQFYHYSKPFSLSENQAKVLHTFPIDYEHPKKLKLAYLMGMSVPPVMVAQIATRIYDQWLSKLK